MQQDISQNISVYIRPLLDRAMLSVHTQAGRAAHFNHNWYSMLWLVCVLSAYTNSSAFGTSRSVAAPAADFLQLQPSSFSHNAMQH